MTARFLFLIAALTVLLRVGQSQDIRREDSIPRSIFSAVYRSAEEYEPRSFPDLKDSEKGTLVKASYGFSDADITILCGKEFPQEKVLALAKQIANAIKKPRTDFIVGTGRRLQFVDLEFNEYIEKDMWSSRITLPFGDIGRIILDSDLPRPIGFAIELDRNQTCNLDGPIIQKTHLMGEGELPVKGELVFARERHWYGLLAALGMGLLMVGVTFGLPIVLYRSVTSKPPESKEEAKVPTTVKEAQEMYEAPPAEVKQLRWLKYLPLPILPMFFFMEDATLWMPNGPSPAFMVAPFVILIPTMVVAFIVRKRKGIMAPSDPATERMMRPMRVMMIPMAIMMSLLVVRTVFPSALNSVSPLTVRYIIFTPVGLSLIYLGYSVIAGPKKSQIRLGPGDLEYDASMEFAKAANVKVSKVVVNKDMPGVNAAASLFGRVFVTEDFREKMPADERRAVIAHEIGHIKGQHAPIFTLIGLFVVTTLVWISGPIREMSESWPLFFRAMVRSPFFIWIPQFAVSLLVISPMRRKAELQADRFALEQVGDFATVACALARIHLVNGSPLTLRAKDERVSSHPSLSKRLDSLRVIAKELGMPIDETELNVILGV